jgi:hypothetical protein
LLLPELIALLPELIVLYRLSGLLASGAWLAA